MHTGEEKWCKPTAEGSGKRGEKASLVGQRATPLGPSRATFVPSPRNPMYLRAGKTPDRRAHPTLLSRLPSDIGGGQHKKTPNSKVRAPTTPETVGQETIKQRNASYAQPVSARHIRVQSPPKFPGK